MYWAAGSLFRAFETAGMNADEYEYYLIANCENENVNTCFTGSSLGYSHKGRAFLGFFHYLYQNDNSSDKIKTVFSKFEPWRKRIINYDSFGTDYPEWGYWWGSNMVLAQSSMTLLLGSIITEGSDHIPDEVLHSNQSAFNYILGVNPVSFSYVSGYGENSVKNIYSAIYTKMLNLLHINARKDTLQKVQIPQTTDIFQNITVNAIWTVMLNGLPMKIQYTVMRQ